MWFILLKFDLSDIHLSLAFVRIHFCPIVNLSKYILRTSKNKCFCVPVVKSYRMGGDWGGGGVGSSKFGQHR